MKRNELRFLAPAALLLAAGLALPTSARAANDGGMAIDGYLNASRGTDCLALREHDGGTRYLTGAIAGLQPGDHVRLYAHPVDGSACNVRGNAYEVSEVLTLWGDDRHRTTYYDHETNGSFETYAYQNNRLQGRYGNRYDGRHGSDDRSGYDPRSGGYGQYEGRYEERRGGELVSLRGRLSDDEGSCPVLHTRDGQTWNLVGDLRRFRDHARARVTGWTDYDSDCGGPALRVRRISYD